MAFPAARESTLIYKILEVTWKVVIAGFMIILSGVTSHFVIHDNYCNKFLSHFVIAYALSNKPE